MPYRVIFMPEAEAQLLALEAHIAKAADPETAKRFVDAIVDYCLGLATFPRRGRRREELRPGLRTVGFRRRATIAFVVGDDTVVILGVFYGGQDIESRLGRHDEA